LNRRYVFRPTWAAAASGRHQPQQALFGAVRRLGADLAEQAAHCAPLSQRVQLGEQWSAVTDPG
jgi:hypothetical protein